jgi:hypothetical protein
MEEELEKHLQNTREFVQDFLRDGLFMADYRFDETDGVRTYRKRYANDALLNNHSARRWMRDAARKYKIPFIRGTVYDHYADHSIHITELVIPRRKGTQPLLAALAIRQVPNSIGWYERYKHDFVVHWGRGVVSVHYRGEAGAWILERLRTDPQLRKAMNLPACEPHKIAA